MSTVVYHGLPSFLESQHNESRTLRLKLASPRSHLSHSLEMAICTVLDSDSKILFREIPFNIGDIPRQKFDNPSVEASSKPQLAGLSFLQTLPPSIDQTPTEKYVHPLVKRASSVLSDKSLELCTENLGSETGTDIIGDENNIFLPISSNADNGESLKKSHPRKSCASGSRKSAPKTFPPPLSTMMGTDTVRVQPIRENGRLILQVVKVQPRASCFQAERSNGRLRLRFLDADNSSCCSTDNEHIDSARDDTANCDSNKSSEGHHEDTQESLTKVEGAVGNSKVEWEGRCKEGGGHGNTEGLLVNSESLWVASSSS